MAKLSERERELYELVRQHKTEEERIADFLNGNIALLNEKPLLALVEENHRRGEEIRELFDEFGSVLIQDSSVRDHLIKIRNKKSETDELYSRSPFFNLLTNELRPVDEINKNLRQIEEEEEQRLTETLDEMIGYIIDNAGGSLTFDQRKKEFGTLIVGKSLPKNLNTYLVYIKHCYLLNMNEAVIGLSRILLEIACQSIYDKLPEKNKLIDINGEISCRRMIRKACQCQLRTLGKSKKDIQNIQDKAIDIYNEASDILHGKLEKFKTDQETLNFIREVFSVIEALY